MRTPDRTLVHWCIYWVGIGFIVWCLTQATGCGGGPLECTPPELSEAYIVGGVPSTEPRSTVDLKRCTGIIVGPRTILTAAHCVGLAEFRRPGEEVFLDLAPEQLVRPEAETPGARDLRLVFLPEALSPFPQEQWAVLGTVDDGPLVAQGYGVGSGGALHEREVWVCEQSSGVILGTESICNGDSGGPLYALTPDGPKLVGVASFGFSTPYECKGPTGFVDLNAQGNWGWLQRNLR